MKQPKTFMVDHSIRVFDFNLKEYVEKLWDENIPIIRHAVLEGVGIQPKYLEGVWVTQTLESLCQKLDLHVCSKYLHRFESQGVSVVFILQESHLAVHTWPEKGYLHADIVTCAKEDLSLTRLVHEFGLFFKTSSLRLLKFKY